VSFFGGGRVFAVDWTFDSFLFPDVLIPLSYSTSHDQKIVVLDFTDDIEGAEIFV